MEPGFRAAYLAGQQARAERRLEDAIALLSQAVELDPAHAGARLELGMALLAAGRLTEGFAQYEWRELRRRRAAFMRANYAYPEWRGEPLAGKRLLVLGEQGFGDQILMARFLPRLDAAEVVYVGGAELERLFAQLPVRYLRQDLAKERPDADYWIFVMSIPERLGVTLESLPAGPYLHAPARHTGGRIGFAWQGAAYNPNDRFRSLPPEIVARLLGRPGVVSLQPRDTGAADFQATAEIVAGLDLVVSVDTAVAHLAGAMGKETLVMLGAHGLDWQWLAGRSDSPWYPSVRVIRQPAPGDWDAVAQAVEAALPA